ncbi:cysteine protease [Sporothrix eucalyptigena]|uniref:Cysteine protease n=1 Tax=Sporothrix eucalyptigena TaxID=1812306 RepID=A0ABP0CQD2_9PEZI
MEAKAKEQEALISQSSGKTAISHVVAAVELYMKAVQEATTPADRSRLRKKCVELMAYGESLKTAETATVENGMSSLSLETKPESPKATVQPPLPLTAAAPAAVATPTKSPASLAPISKAPGRRAPVSIRELPKREQIIILKASKLHGSVFPPWDTTPGEDAFTLASSSNTLYEDTTPFSMSSQQSDIFTGWKRPSELFTEGTTDQDASSNTRGGAITDKFMLVKGEPDLVQDITTDCSVVASLCAMTKYASDHGGQASLLSSIMSPFDHTKGQPVVSENGKYIFRMYFNGAFRKVIVDDRLPSSTPRALFVVDRRNPLLLWPALLEKAYLKVHGGYDFPGSNSGTDLWVLTGWIPEQVFIQSNEADLDQVWTRIMGAFKRGDVMVTLGTGRLSSEEEMLLGLAGEHDYAVLDLEVDSNGVRRMLVKNPWCDNLVWRGRGLSSVSDTESTSTTGTFWIGFEDVVQYYESLYLNWNPSLFNHRQDHHFSWTLPTKTMAHSFASNPQYAMVPDADGTVWILLNRHFQDAELDIVRRKRRSVSAFLSRQGNAEQAALPTSQPNPSSPNQVGFISLYVFSADGKRVQLPDRPRWINRAPLVDSPQTLVCFEARRGVPYTIVVAQSALPLPSYSFTLSFFSSASLKIEPAVEMLAHQYELSDEWSRATAGGSVASPDFVQNPQYALTIPKPTPLNLLLCAEADDVPVRVDLVWARGQRVASLALRDLVVSSGEYQRGCALATVTPRTSSVSATSNSPVPHMPGSVSSGNGSGSAGFGLGLVDPGTYTVVVSTFERAQMTKYTLRVGSAVPVELRPIPAEDSGKLRTSLEPLMLTFDGTPGGGHGGGLGDGDEGELRTQAVLNTRLNTRVSLVVQAVERRAQNVYTSTAAAAAAASTTAVRVSVERMATGSGRRNGDVVATTGEGEFQDMTVAGLRTGEITLGRASPYLGRDLTTPWFRVVVEMRNGRRLPNVGIRVDILSSDRVEARPWEEF